MHLFSLNNGALTIKTTVHLSYKLIYVEQIKINYQKQINFKAILVQRYILNKYDYYKIKTGLRCALDLNYTEAAYRLIL